MAEMDLEEFTPKQEDTVDRFQIFADSDSLPDDTRIYADLLKHGYTDLPESNGIRVGSRVRHVGERWDSAIDDGTATVLHLMENVDSSWAHTYGRRDIELIVRRDKPRFNTDVSQWANYHTILVINEQAALAAEKSNQ